MVEGKENYLDVITPKEKATAEEKEEVEFLRKNRDLIVVHSHVQRLCARYGLRLRYGAPEVLNKKVKRLVKEACLRCKLNGRRTVLPKDF